MPSTRSFGAGGRLHLRVAVPGWSFGGGRSRLPDRVGKCQQVIRARLLWRCGHGKAKDFPATRNRE